LPLIRINRLLTRIKKIIKVSLLNMTNFSISKAGDLIIINMKRDSLSGRSDTMIRTIRGESYSFSKTEENSKTL
jgi:hypothetical protein